LRRALSLGHWSYRREPALGIQLPNWRSCGGPAMTRDGAFGNVGYRSHSLAKFLQRHD
jgi:hypothetical protein